MCAIDKAAVRVVCVFGFCVCLIFGLLYVYAFLASLAVAGPLEIATLLVVLDPDLCMAAKDIGGEVAWVNEESEYEMLGDTPAT